MPRFLIAVLVTAVLLVPATAQGHSGARLRGTVALKDVATHLVTVKAARQAFALRVPGSLEEISVGQRVELRGSTLRARGGEHESRVLARDVTIASSGPLSTSSQPRKDHGEGVAAADEVEIKGKLASLSPVTVVSATRTVSCVVPSGMVLSGFVMNELVEMKCDLVGTTWTLRKLEHEDDHAAARGEDEDEDQGDDDGGGHHHGSGGGGGHDDD